MGGRRGMILLATAAAAAGGLLSASATAAERYPTLWLFTDATSLGAAASMEFEVSDLETAGDTQSIVISVPAGYALSLARAVGANLGTAAITAKGGGSFKGSLTQMSPAAYAASTSAQACAPGQHTAIWAMNVTSSGSAFSIPIAVDPGSGGYRLTMCFDDLHAQGIEVSDVDFARNGGITTPRHARQYLFQATVTPFAADGTPDSTSVYELEANESLPRALSIDATYRAATKTLTVSGVGLSVKHGMNGRWVTVWTANKVSDFKRAGYVRTSSTGRYTFTKRLARPPKYADAEVENVAGQACAAATPAPAGCAATSFGGTDSGYVRVTVG